jgi:hypothetical protein
MQGRDFSDGESNSGDSDDSMELSGHFWDFMMNEDDFCEEDDW